MQADPQLTWLQREQMCRAKNHWDRIIKDASSQFLPSRNKTNLRTNALSIVNSNAPCTSSSSSPSSGRSSPALADRSADKTPTANDGAESFDSADEYDDTDESATVASLSTSSPSASGKPRKVVRTTRQSRDNVASTSKPTAVTSPPPTPARQTSTTLPHDDVERATTEYGGVPWIDEDTTTYHNGLAGLHNEILDFCQWIAPQKHEFSLRYSVYERVKCACDTYFNGYATVEYFGSFRTAIFLPTSDIDVVVILPRRAKFGELDDLAEVLCDLEICEKKNIQVLDKAAVPIIKLVDEKTKIRVDISFNMTHGVGTAELVKTYLHEYPSLRYLLYVLKQFLLLRNLNEVYHGGISSYALTLMVVSFLQTHYPLREYPSMALTPTPAPDTNLGMLLINFLELYGRDFDYMKLKMYVGVTAQGTRAEYLPKEGFHDVHGVNTLSIADPLQKDNDVGRSSYGVLRVKKAFKYAYDTLCSSVLAPHQDGKGHLSRIIRITDSVINYRLSLYALACEIHNEQHGGDMPLTSSTTDEPDAQALHPDAQGVQPDAQAIDGQAQVVVDATLMPDVVAIEEHSPSSSMHSVPPNFTHPPPVYHYDHMHGLRHQGPSMPAGYHQQYPPPQHHHYQIYDAATASHHEQITAMEEAQRVQVNYHRERHMRHGNGLVPRPPTMATNSMNGQHIIIGPPPTMLEDQQQLLAQQHQLHQHLLMQQQQHRQYVGTPPQMSGANSTSAGQNGIEESEHRAIPQLLTMTFPQDVIFNHQNNTNYNHSRVGSWVDSQTAGGLGDGVLIVSKEGTPHSSAQASPGAPDGNIPVSYASVASKPRGAHEMAQSVTSSVESSAMADLCLANDMSAKESTEDISSDMASCSLAIAQSEPLALATTTVDLAPKPPLSYSSVLRSHKRTQTIDMADSPALSSSSNGEQRRNNSVSSVDDHSGKAKCNDSMASTRRISPLTSTSTIDGDPFVSNAACQASTTRSYSSVAKSTATVTVRPYVGEQDTKSQTTQTSSASRSSSTSSKDSPPTDTSTSTLETSTKTTVTCVLPAVNTTTESTTPTPSIAVVEEEPPVTEMEKVTPVKQAPPQTQRHNKRGHLKKGVQRSGSTSSNASSVAQRGAFKRGGHNQTGTECKGYAGSSGGSTNSAPREFRRTKPQSSRGGAQHYDPLSHRSQPATGAYVQQANTTTAEGADSHNWRKNMVRRAEATKDKSAASARKAANNDKTSA